MKTFSPSPISFYIDTSTHLQIFGVFFCFFFLNWTHPSPSPFKAKNKKLSARGNNHSEKCHEMSIEVELNIRTIGTSYYSYKSK